MTLPRGLDDGQDAHWDQISSADVDPSRDKRGSRRRRSAIVGALAAVAVVGAAVTAVAVGLGGDDSASALGDDAVPSNSRALSAAVLAHVPSNVEVVWATGYPPPLSWNPLGG